MAIEYSKPKGIQTIDFTRRILVKAGAVATLSGMLSACGVGDKANDLGEGQKIAEMPIGLQTWSIRDALQLNPRNTLLQLARFGFKEIELFDIATTDPIAKLAKSIGFDLVGLHFWELFDTDGSWERWKDKGNKSELMKGVNLDYLSDKANEYGMRHLVFAGDAPDSACRAMDDARRYCDAIQSVGKEIRSRGLRFLYHPHMADLNDLGGGITVFDLLVQLTDPADVGFEIDVFWFSHVGSDPADAIRKLGGRAEILHLKDRRRGVPLAAPLQGYPAEKSLFVPIGTGSINFNAILTAAKTSGLRHLIIEQDEAQGDPVVSLQQSYSHLRGELALL